MTSIIKTYIFTGANQGLGLGAIKQLVTRPDLLVFLGSRQLEAGVKAAQSIQTHPSTKVVVLQLDVTDDSSISRAVDFVRSALKERKLPEALDVLVNNAGVYLEGKSSGRQILLDTFDVNVFGAQCMIEAFLPLLKASKTPLVFNVSSTLGSTSKPWPEALNTNYNPSKAALNNITKNNSLIHKDVRFISFCPGYNATNLNDHNQYARDPVLGAKAIVNAILDKDIVSGSYLNESGPLQF